MIAGAAAWACVIPPSVALIYFAIEVLLGLRKLPPPLMTSPGDLRVAVVIPAHNEALLIALTVSAVREKIAPASRVLVVADNCSDETAEKARLAGAEVIERCDLTRIGKGFALAHARDHLSSDPPDAVFILDADCQIVSGRLDALAYEAMTRGEPVQARNLLTAAQDAPPLVQLSNFAMLMKNVVRARGLYRIAGGITLFGTGMVFPWRVFESLPLATSETVEDLHLALVLARQGIRVHFSEELLVTSPAAGVDDSLGQRSRWEHGFLTNSLKKGIPILGKGLAARSRHAVGLGAHLLVPPLALLFLIAACALVAAVGLAFFSGAVLPVALLVLSIVSASVATAVAWYREGRSTVGLRAMVTAPLYVAWKIPLYVGFLLSRQTQWNRTRRVNERS